MQSYFFRRLDGDAFESPIAPAESLRELLGETPPEVSIALDPRLKNLGRRALAHDCREPRQPNKPAHV